MRAARDDTARIARQRHAHAVERIDSSAMTTQPTTNRYDVITAIDDQPVTSNDDFLSYLERKRPGDEVTISTERAGETRTFQLRLAESQ